MYKAGDRVVKARPYSDTFYCKYGGSRETVLLGATGSVQVVDKDGYVSVIFGNRVCWVVV